MAAQKPTYWLLEPERGFQIVTIEKDGPDNVQVKVVPDSLQPRETIFETKKLHLHSSDALDELVYLKFFSIDNVVNCLKWRYNKDLIYTNSGLFLIAVNPFKVINGVYSIEQIESFSKSFSKSSKPHIYSVVQSAYREMVKHEVDQSILVSGLSGSGKTETVKIAINYLSVVGSGSGTLEQQINVAGLVLESFGNAKTIHNGNSSRFGKYTKIFFEKKSGKMVGAEVKTYLLEKSRVANVPDSERNFHIFYQLIKGLSPKEKEDLMLGSVNDFIYLRNGKGDDITSDVKHFTGLREQFKVLGINTEEQDKIYKLVAGILHLGNIKFGEKNGQIAFVEDQSALTKAAKLLGVSPQALEKALTSLEMKSMDIVIQLNKSKAELSRDSLAKEIFERLFDWIVGRVNKVLKYAGDVDDCGYIAILDISGYESVPVNGFEQLNINYTNDKLQQLFNTVIYKEQELYQEELNWETVDIDIDLKSAISLVEKDGEGLYSILNEVCYRQDASDVDFMKEISLVYSSASSKKNKNFSLNENKQQCSIIHGPGQVAYTIKDFLVKNRDLLAKSLETLMQQSSSPLLKGLFEVPKPRVSIGKSTVVSFFMTQMEGLLDAIAETDAHYIKCVKPNRESESNNFDVDYVKEQVKWSGIVETIQICDKGYPAHFEFDKFLSRYSELGKVNTSQDTRHQCQSLLEQVLKPNEFAVGKTQVFLGLGSRFKLDLMLDGLKKKDDTSSSSQNPNWLQKTKQVFSWLFN